MAVTGVKLNKSSTSLVVGTKEKVTATVSPSNATNKKVTWKSSNTSVATVDSDGTIKGIKAGSATITVTTKDGAKTDKIVVTVTSKAVSVTGVKLNVKSNIL